MERRSLSGRRSSGRRAIARWCATAASRRQIDARARGASRCDRQCPRTLFDTSRTRLEDASSRHAQDELGPGDGAAGPSRSPAGACRARARRPTPPGGRIATRPASGDQRPPLRGAAGCPGPRRADRAAHPSRAGPRARPLRSGARAVGGGDGAASRRALRGVRARRRHRGAVGAAPRGALIGRRRQGPAAGRPLKTTMFRFAPNAAILAGFSSPSSARRHGARGERRRGQPLRARRAPRPRTASRRSPGASALTSPSRSTRGGGAARRDSSP